MNLKKDCPMLSNNIRMIQTVAEGLGELNNQVVFVGGAIIELYAQKAIAEEIRSTLDVDCIVELSSRMEFDEIQEKIRLKGFRHDISQGAPIFRWIFCGIRVDIMPPDEKILGFSNMWYIEGLKFKIEKQLPNGMNIYIFPIQYFLATKFEAHKNRGNCDLRQSHDFEDVIYILDNCPDVYNQICYSENNVKNYLSHQCQKLLMNSNLLEGIESALPYGASYRRTELIENLLKEICKCS